MNADIRANPVLDSPYFDLAGHVGSRAYCMENLVYATSSDETAVLLDVGVRDLLPCPIPPPATPSPKARTFEIHKSEGENGLGMFAAQNIPAGGLILVERPTLVAPYIIGLPTDPESDLYGALLGRLSPDTVARFMALANCKPDCDLVEGIMRTNAIAVTLDVPDVPHPELTTHRAVFLNTSRCNHSCAPNAMWHWDVGSFSLALEALRPIPAGDEITVAYITPTYSRAERRAQLHAMYTFSCRCEVCARPAAAIAQSDAARAEIHAFWDSADVPAFEDWCLDPRLGDMALIDAHKRAVALIESEGLQMLEGYGKHLDAIAMGYGALRDVEEFRAWAWRARDARPVGRDAAAARVLQKWMIAPETFPVWGWRKSLQRSRRGSVELL
ncbi:hypothetical protein B0H11DRAFT_1701227 [Mycena galericulata]|nr:hypothetical protein B0H11DRAFT_1755654 [Mycena galericulata]KAJ7511000.1 hypothetical protein B0H11DRAFT_1701227 [Mycena galericulata]